MISVIMANSLINLPTEIQLAILVSLNTLDDAVNLANTCRGFSALFAGYKGEIARKIVVSWNPCFVSLQPGLIFYPQLSSDVYQYDLCLFKLNKAHEKMSGRDRQTPPEDRPLPRVFWSCMEANWLNETSIDEIVRYICQHWQKTKILRELYLDPNIVDEFDSFRSNFETFKECEGKADLVKPGFSLPGSRRSGLSKLCLRILGLGKYVFRRQHNDRNRCERQCHFGPNFSARFHKALCLHSIAVVSRLIAIFDLRELEPLPIHEIWIKESVYIGGNLVRPATQEKLDCLEVYDFIYLFLLRKAVPPEYAYSWHLHGTDWFDLVIHERVLTLIRAGMSWFHATAQIRRCLQPFDVADLISQQVCESKKEDARDWHRYLSCRGMSAFGGVDRVTWFNQFGRASMVRALIAHGGRDPVWYDKQDYSWWDRFRVRAGSPFDPRFDLRSLRIYNDFPWNCPQPIPRHKKGASAMLADSEQHPGDP